MYSVTSPKKTFVALGISLAYYHRDIGIEDSLNQNLVFTEVDCDTNSYQEQSAGLAAAEE